MLPEKNCGYGALAEHGERKSVLAVTESTHFSLAHSSTTGWNRTGSATPRQDKLCAHTPSKRSTPDVSEIASGVDKVLSVSYVVSVVVCKRNNVLVRILH